MNSILGIGTDIVEIERFKNFHRYSPACLSRIFSTPEIEYALHDPCKSSERFALRFALREALFKACCTAQIIQPTEFLAFMKSFSIVRKPYPTIVWHTKQYEEYKVFISASHSQTMALAYVIVTKDL